MIKKTANTFAIALLFVTLTSQFAQAAPDRKLPQTTRVRQQLTDIQNSINSIASKASRAEKAVESARKEAQRVASLISTIRRLDDKVGRIYSQLKTLVRIPQLRLLKPLVENLSHVRKQVHNVRKKADQVNRDYLQPLISKLKSAEKKMEGKVKEIRNAANQTAQANRKLGEFTSYVAGRGYKRIEVQAVEALARPVGSSVNQARQSISQLDRELGNLESGFNSLTRQLSGLNKAKSAVTKLDNSLKKADKVAGDINKVLSKAITINLGFKKFTFTVRKVIESPGKVVDVALKPLQKLASKVLAPVMKKVKIKINVPREITAMTKQMDQLRSMASNINGSISKIQRATQKKISQNFTNQLQKINSKTTSSLTRR